MFHFYSFVNNNKEEMQQESHLIEVKTGQKLLIQRKNTILGNAHYFIKRTQSGYEPAYIMLSEKGVRMRFCFPAE